PPFEPRIVAEDEDTVTYVNALGQTAKGFKDDPDMMPMFVDWPVKDRATWREFKKRLDPAAPGRYPVDWNAYVQEMSGKSEPLSLPVGGFYGFIRNWVGTIEILYMFYDE